MYPLLDKFFFVFHSGIIVYELAGWAWKRTCVANLILMLITAFSWFILGIWYGFGYCFRTDWHYRIRIKLGYKDTPSSYVKSLIDSLSGLDMNAILIDIFTFAFFFLALIASIVTNVQDLRKRRRSTTIAK